MSESMFSRFTERARRIVILARDEAEQRHYEYLGTEHLLLGMLKDGSGVAIGVLQDAGLTIDKVRSEIQRHIQSKASSPAFSIVFTPVARQVLVRAVEEAQLMGFNTTGSEHILLGLLKESSGIACIVLNTLGVQLDQVRQKILDIHKAQ